MKGRFITLEGGEGSGKSTQVRALAEAFKDAGISLVTTREPGGSPAAERVRALVVEGHADDWSASGETLLFTAARAEHWGSTVAPALAEGTHVLCDRFLDSTIAYQGAARGLSAAYIRTLTRCAIGNKTPDLTFILDIPPQQGLTRAAARRGQEARFENLSLDFHHAVRNAFLTIAHKEPQRCVIIDATQPIKKITNDLKREIVERLGIAL